MQREFLDAPTFLLSLLSTCALQPHMYMCCVLLVTENLAYPCCYPVTSQLVTSSYNTRFFTSITLIIDVQSLFVMQIVRRCEKFSILFFLITCSSSTACVNQNSKLCFLSMQLPWCCQYIYLGCVELSRLKLKSFLHSGSSNFLSRLSNLTSRLRVLIAQKSEKKCHWHTDEELM